MTLRSVSVILFAVSSAALLLSACQPKPAATADASAAPAVDTAKEEAAIRQMEADWSKEMAAKDPAKMGGHYAPDAAVAFTGAPLMNGPAEVQKTIGPMMQDPNFALSFSPDKVVVAKSGDLAYTAGRYTITGTDPKTKQPAKTDGAYTTVYAKGADGKWQVVVDYAIDLPKA